MDNQTQERRNFKRLTTSFKVSGQEIDLYKELNLSTSSVKEFKGKTLNISANGALIECEKNYPDKTLLNLSFEMPEWEKYKKSFFSRAITLPSPPFNVTAEVIRSKTKLSNKRNLAVKFLALDAVRANAINAMIKDYAHKKELK